MSVQNKLPSSLYQDILTINSASLNQIKERLLEQLKINLVLTPSEPFDWEDDFLKAGGTNNQMVEMKKSRPAFGNHFYFKGLVVNDQRSVLMAQVTRVLDQKDFNIDLDLLETQNSSIPEFDVLKEYSIWFYSLLENTG